MSKTNCINCGAAKDIEEIKCPFCGTTYLDLTAIDFSSNKPIVCEFVMPYKKAVVQMLAIPRLEKAEIKQELTDFYFGGDRGCLVRNYSAEFEATFTPVPRNGVLFTTREIF